MNIIVAILILGIIIIIHELGHFLLAKKNGITVTEFSVGMGPRIASFVKNGTRYSLKLLPIGGSCMMLGEDEAIDDEGAFQKKGIWARFSVLFAGAFFNFILAFVLALIVLGVDGVDLPVITDVKNNSPASEANLQEGDLITKINDTTVNLGRDIELYYYFNPLTEKPIQITYERAGVENTVSLKPVMLQKYLLGCTFEPSAENAKLLTINEGFPLDLAGLEVGDIIVSIENNSINSGLELSSYLENYPLTDQPITLSYIKGNDLKSNPIAVTIKPVLQSSRYQIGASHIQYKKLSAIETFKYSFYELRFNIVNTIKSLGYLISGRVSMNEVAGPVGITNMVGEIVSETKSYGIGVTLLSLARFSIIISANLGVMNLLPIPALDGGRLVFLLIEAIRRKPVPKEKEAMVHVIGMAALMIFMIFIVFNDIRNIFG